MQEQDRTHLNKPPANQLEKPPTRNYGVLFLCTLALIIAVTSLLFQFFFWELHKKTEEKMLNNAQLLQQRIQPTFQQLHTLINHQQKVINEILAHIQLKEKGSAILLAQEAEYLIQLSQYQLLFESNINLASKLLENADQKLQQANDPVVNPIRKALANDIVNLNTIPKLDITGLISRIAAISNQVNKLSLLPPISPSPIKAKLNGSITWKEKFTNALHSLQAIFTIRRLQEPVKPLVSLEQQYYIVENIRLHLSEAQWAILHQNPTLYNNSLEQAKEYLQRYFFRNPTGNNLIQMIKQLQQINIKPNVPDLSNTLTLIRNYINSQQTSSIPSQQQPHTSIDEPAAAKPATITAPRALPS